ncbi:hypothetical protein GSF27_03235 [Pseudomaricurvus sp. HS19]|nr:hypothetical protein [Pseudomaricurvus sp. HS19]
MQQLAALPAATLAKLPEDQRNDPQAQQEVARLLLQSLTMSALATLGADGDHPQFLPSIGEILNVGQPNADTIYKAADISPGGIYRLRGHKGSLNMSVIGQVGPSPADPGSDGNHPGQTRNYLYLDSLPADQEGRFDVLLSPERPKGYKGDWWKLHPKTYRLMLRQVSSDWSQQVDPAIAIERVDIPVRRLRPSASELEARLRRLPKMTEFMATMFVDQASKLRQQGYVNKLRVLDVAAIGGLDGQFYYEGVYDLQDDEALIIEAKQPASCRYRSVILVNEIYQTLDWYNNQSSLNETQAKADSDDVLRVVVASQDPGVPNWLDTAGFSSGVVQGRWTACDSQPIPNVKKVALGELRKYLPADTAHVSNVLREQIIRERRAAYQLRRHW